MVRVSILGSADPEEPLALAGLMTGAFAAADEATAGLFAFEPTCPALLEATAGELFA